VEERQIRILKVGVCHIRDRLKALMSFVPKIVIIVTSKEK